jgi:lipopolysaccharide export system protein LptA
MLPIFVLLVVLSAGSAAGQDILDQAGEKYEVTAGTVRVINTEQGRVTLLEGGVTITHGSAVITAQSGKGIEAKDEAVLEGEVRIVDGETTMESRTGEYFRRGKRAVLRGDVRIDDGRELVQADEVTYFRDSKIASASGSVSFKNKANEVTVEGGKGTYYFEEDRGIMEESPLLTASGEKQILITSQTMETFDKEAKALVAGDVKVYQEDVTAACDSLIYMSRDDVAMLIGSPWIAEGANRMESANIRLEFANRKLNRAVLTPDAKGFYSVGEGEANTVSGDEMIIVFQDGKAGEVTVNGSAGGTYYMKKKGK